MSSKRRMSAELTIMSLWATLSDEGKRIIADWVRLQVQPSKPKAQQSERKPRADKGVQRGLPKGTPKPTVGLMDVSNGGDTDDAG